MGLKQDIVIRSEYTNNVRSAEGRGSRGASPGQYVMRYMAREDATEVLAPVKLDLASGDGFGFTPSYDSAEFTRYMVRRDATERLKSKNDELLNDPDAYGSPLVLKHKFRSMEKLSGRAFGSKGISLSHSELEQSSEEIQQAFDEGHSVQKIIISFTEDYLRRTGVLDPSFKHKGRGSYKGHIDQLKLRRAIMNGVDNMTKAGRFIDPEWVGTIQLDTSHVHAHIALVDKKFSPYRMKKDGADRGKINEREKKMFRKGIHFSLEDMRDLKSFHKQTSLERQNVVAFVKDYAYETLRENTSIQLLIASLPEERAFWRYGTNRKSMKYANELAVGIVERVFANEPERSGYREAMKAVMDYADESARVNKLSAEEKEQLIKKGRERIIERSVNGLYSTLKSLGKDLLQVRTPMIDIQASSDEELAQALAISSGASDNEFDPAAFTLRVRGYNERQKIHTDEAREFYGLITEYDWAYDNGLVDDTAHVMRLFYEEELRYHMGVTDKYRTFMSFHHDKDREHIEMMKPVYEDLVKRYNYIVSDEKETGLKLVTEREEYLRDLKKYTFECFVRGVGSLKEWEAINDYNRENGTIETRFVLPIQPKPRAENLSQTHFSNVKALDVHHLGLDYYNRADARIDETNALRFANAYEWREIRAESAKIYVESTGQHLPALDRALSDIKDMGIAVQKAVDEGLIQTVTLDDIENLSEHEKRQLYTIPVDHSVDVVSNVRVTLEQLEAIEQEERERELRAVQHALDSREEQELD